MLQAAAVLHAALAIAVPWTFPRSYPYTYLPFVLWPLWLYPLLKFRDGSVIGVVVAVVLSVTLLAAVVPSALVLLALYLGAHN